MIDAAIEKAEQQIQRILLDLADETGRDIDFVNVDTRPFANLKVEIFFQRNRTSAE